MFHCDDCDALVPPRTKPNKVIAKKRKKFYEYDEGKKVIQGWEIVKEINICDECYEKREQKNNTGM